MARLTTTPSSAQSIVMDNQVAAHVHDTPNDGRSQNSAIPDTLPDFAVLSLTDSDVSDRGTLTLLMSPRGGAYCTGRIVTILQTIVHVTQQLL
ncbi:hypothetical protein GSI_13419 [Ganoderma sinense ZZ0214-1]|uniref:Uncharacterized protein n=1 Tax=Ganoderma sinense ZZ0214-1 TaxID=1077348 RepID=A0A2G8RQ78_9APHY|nr:hypothetical protein GSI_13419 [Ganoderma sinense ZZ0214-1]